MATMDPTIEPLCQDHSTHVCIQASKHLSSFHNRTCGLDPCSLDQQTSDTVLCTKSTLIRRNQVSLHRQDQPAIEAWLRKTSALTARSITGLKYDCSSIVKLTRSHSTPKPSQPQTSKPRIHRRCPSTWTPNDRRNRIDDLPTRETISQPALSLTQRHYPIAP